MKEKFDENELDQLFHNKLAGEEVAPREIVWTNISRGLGGAAKKPVAWIWWLSGIILILGIGSWFVFNANLKNKLVGNKTSGWNYKDSINGGFDSVPNDKNGEQSGIVKIEGGKYSSAGADSVNSINKNSTSANVNSPIEKKNDQDANAELNKAITERDKPKPYDPGDAHSKKKSTIVKKNPVDVENKTQFSEAEAERLAGILDRISDKQNIPAYDPMMDSLVDPGPEKKENEIVKVSQVDPPIVSQTTLHDKKDSINNPTQITSKDTSRTIDPSVVSANPVPVVQNPETIFPIFYAGIHGGLDAGKIAKSTLYEGGLTNTDIKIYNGNELASLPKQTYSFGARFGWFANKRISITGGAYYSIFETNPSVGHFKYNHNYQYDFVMHSATSYVNCSSENFDHNDSEGPPSDTVYITIQSQEKYDYVNTQLGVSVYALRTKHLGIYANFLTNESFLMKKSMTLSIPHSGKTLSYSSNEVYGMNKFVLGGQIGLGAEWLPFGNFGLYIEPSYFFSGKLNTSNVISLKPGGMKYLAGLIYHF